MHSTCVKNSCLSVMLDNSAVYECALDSKIHRYYARLIMDANRDLA